MNRAASPLVITALAAVALAAGGASGVVDAQDQGLAVGRPEWAAAVRHDTSRPLREIVPTPPVSTRQDFAVKMAPPPQQAGQQDDVVQSFVVAPLAAASGLSFDGVGEGNPQFSYNVNVAPPDTVGEAGQTQFVQWVNTSFAVFDKATGTKLYGPAGGNTLWAGFGGPCQNRNDGDPIVQYDQLADRWVMTQFALQSGNYTQCVAVSQSGDAMGAWHRYAFSYAQFPDYPKLAVWPDAYYITFNMFGNGGGSFTGSRVCAYDRDKMLQGLPATQICHQLSYPQVYYPSLLAADLEGRTLPPAGTPNFVMNRGTNVLNVWRFTPNFANGTSSFVGPTVLPVSSYSAACSRNCVPQPNTTQLLDALGDRLMYRLSYRNLGSRQAMVVNHSVNVGGRTSIRWYELAVSGTTVSVSQQATYAPSDGQHRWMGSIAMDQVGNIAMGYSISSTSQKPSIRFAGRETTDPAGFLSMDESLHPGTGSQLATLSRWGDYSAMTIDPVDDCTFWFTSEYLQTNGTFNWSTRVGSFKFTSCSGGTPPPPPSPTFSLAASPSSQSVVQGESTAFDVTVSGLNGYTGSGSFSVSGLPTGASASWSNAGYAGGSGSSQLTVTTAGNTPIGSSQLSITATDTSGTPVQTTQVTLNVTAAPNPDFTISASPANRTVKRGKSGTYTVSVTALDGFGETVALSVDGLPSGSSASFSPASLTGSSSSTLTVTTSNPSTPKGTFTLTITGTSASRTRSTTVSLKVQ